MADSKSILHDLFKDMGQAMIDGQRIAQEAEAEFMAQARQKKAMENASVKPVKTVSQKR